MKASQIARKIVALALVVSALAGSASAQIVDTPEIDPGSIASALTMLAGGVMLFKGRRAK